MNWEKAWIYLMLFLFFFLGVIVNSAYNNRTIGLSGNGNESNLFGYSSKINKEVIEIWKYNTSNIGKNINLEQLKSEGGVCEHYAEYYVDKTINETNLYARTVIIDVNKSVAHEFAVLSNEEGYCIMDQIIMWCFEFAKAGVIKQ